MLTVDLAFVFRRFCLPRRNEQGAIAVNLRDRNCPQIQMDSGCQRRKIQPVNPTAGAFCNTIGFCGRCCSEDIVIVSGTADQLVVPTGSLQNIVTKPTRQGVCLVIALQPTFPEPPTTASKSVAEFRISLMYAYRA
jgi:hypothetical protein